jgi:outer membrane protein OmpA-like peptidoglycan-associated protein
MMLSIMTRHAMQQYRRSYFKVLPAIFCSVGVLLISQSAHAESVPQTTAEQPPKIVEVPSNCDEDCVPQGALQYVGGSTRIGIGLDTDLKVRGDLSHVFQETDDTVTSASAWVGVDPQAENDSLDPTLTGAGAQVNHHWVSKGAEGAPTHVNKAFVAIDQNGKRRRKLSAGYGQEREDLFWEGYGSKSFSEEFHIGHDEHGNEVVQRAYDYGVGGRVGKTLDKQLVRVRGGVDYEWGTEYGNQEDRPTQLTATAGVEKFFQDSPHSVSLNVSTYQKEGGHDGGLENSGTRANVNYRYDLGNSVFRSDELYRRVRVELPGQPKPPQYKKELVKNTMEMEADNFFKLNSHELTDQAKKRLDTVIARVRGAQRVGNVRITGNTCNLGSLEHNQILSERRASAVKAYFITQGFSANELEARGLGETAPKYPNTPENAHKNRRVDIEYVSEQKKFKQITVDKGSVGEPIITWKQERCPTPPIWAQRALHNPIAYKTIVDDYQTLLSDDKPQLSPDPAPIPDPEPNPEPTPDPNPNPDPDPAPTPDPQPDPDPSPNPEPKPEPKPTNKPPAGKADFITMWVNEKGGVSINPDFLLQNDSDPDGDALEFVGIVQSPNHGSLTADGKAGFKYYPRHNYCGRDAFTYTISDGKGGTDTVISYIDVLQR